MTDATGSHESRTPMAPVPGEGSVPPVSGGGLVPVVSDPTGVASVGDLLLESKGQLGLVSRCLAAGKTDAKEIIEAGAAANAGAVSTIKQNIRTIRDGEIPSAPSKATQALSSTRSFLKQHRDRLSIADRERILATIANLEEAVSDKDAQEKEAATIQVKGDALEARLAEGGGVYVFTYPHYYLHPTIEETGRTLLKVGMTTKDAATRVRQQARQTAVPEDPWILRVYQHPTRDPRDIERCFHKLLEAADHSRADTKTGGTEWFETHLTFLDAIAEALEFHVYGAEGT